MTASLTRVVEYHESNGRVWYKSCAQIPARQYWASLCKIESRGVDMISKRIGTKCVCCDTNTVTTCR